MSLDRSAISARLDMLKMVAGTPDADHERRNNPFADPSGVPAPAPVVVRAGAPPPPPRGGGGGHAAGAPEADDESPAGAGTPLGAGVAPMLLSTPFDTPESMQSISDAGAIMSPVCDLRDTCPLRHVHARALVPLCASVLCQRLYAGLRVCGCMRDWVCACAYGWGSVRP